MTKSILHAVMEVSFGRIVGSLWSFSSDAVVGAEPKKKESLGRKTVL